MLMTSSRGCHEDTTWKPFPWNFSLIQRDGQSGVRYRRAAFRFSLASADILVIMLLCRGYMRNLLHATRCSFCAMTTGFSAWRKIFMRRKCCRHKYFTSRWKPCNYCSALHAINCTWNHGINDIRASKIEVNFWQSQRDPKWIFVCIRWSYKS